LLRFEMITTIGDDRRESTTTLNAKQQEREREQWTERERESYSTYCTQPVLYELSRSYSITAEKVGEGTRERDERVCTQVSRVLATVEYCVDAFLP